MLSASLLIHFRCSFKRWQSSYPLKISTAKSVRGNMCREAGTWLILLAGWGIPCTDDCCLGSSPTWTNNQDSMNVTPLKKPIVANLFWTQGKGMDSALPLPFSAKPSAFKNKCPWAITASLSADNPLDWSKYLQHKILSLLVSVYYVVLQSTQGTMIAEMWKNQVLHEHPEKLCINKSMLYCGCFFHYQCFLSIATVS